jgi:uncharacterized membrane protein YesL
VNILTGGLYRLCEWITRLAYLNLIWILFSMMGFIVLGGMPATVSMFSITRKWAMGRMDIPIFRTFWNSYKREFVKSNLLGIPLFLAGLIFYLDFRVLQSANLYNSLLLVGFICLFIIYLIVLLYVFPVFVHFDIRLWKVLKFGLIIGFSRPHYTLGMAFAAVCMGYLLWSIPMLFPFFSGSVISMMVMWLANRAFASVDQRTKLNLAE